MNTHTKTHTHTNIKIKINHYALLFLHTVVCNEFK